MDEIKIGDMIVANDNGIYILSDKPEDEYRIGFCYKIEEDYVWLADFMGIHKYERNRVRLF